jgi:hypothetical protein
VRSRLVILAAIGLLAACGGSGKPPAVACGTVDRGVIPSWARTGFSEAEPKVPHVDGEHGEITAILFGDVLSSPPAVNRSNKILWVSKDVWQGATDLKIRAVDGKDVVERTVAGGPGPSSIDLPHAGCWRLSLRWADREDTLSLRYDAPA